MRVIAATLAALAVGIPAARADEVTIRGAQVTTPDVGWVVIGDKLGRRGNGPTIELLEIDRVPDFAGSKSALELVDKPTSYTVTHGEHFTRNGVRGIDVRGELKVNGNAWKFRAVCIPISGRAVCARAVAADRDRPAWVREASAILDSMRRPGTAVRGRRIRGLTEPGRGPPVECGSTRSGCRSICPAAGATRRRPTPRSRCARPPAAPPSSTAPATPR